MEPNAEIMNLILQTFLDRIAIGTGAVGFDARGLLAILALMELTLLALWWAYSGSEALGKLIRKVITIFFFIWVIDNYTTILTWVTDGFIYTGQRAAGGGGVDINDPSGIWWQGLQVAKPILEHARAQPGFFGGFGDALISLVSAFVIIVSYFILAIQIFITRIEFAVISTLGLILVPFGVFKHTSFVAEKVFGAVIAFGVKLMVLAFVVSIGFPIMQQLSLPEDPSWPEMFSIMFGSLSLAILALHAPGVASGLLSGGPSLTAGAALGAGLGMTAAGSAAVSAGLTTAKAGYGMAKTGVIGGVGATKLGAAGLGAAGASITAGRASVESGQGFASSVSRVSKTAGVATGAVGAATRATYNGMASSAGDVKQRVKSSLSAAYAAGHSRVTRNLSKKSSTDESGSGSSAGNSSAGNSSSESAGATSAGASGSDASSSGANGQDTGGTTDSGTSSSSSSSGSSGGGGGGSSSSSSEETSKESASASGAAGDEKVSPGGNFSAKDSMNQDKEKANGGARKSRGGAYGRGRSRFGESVQTAAHHSHSAQPGAGLQAHIPREDIDE